MDNMMAKSNIEDGFYNRPKPSRHISLLRKSKPTELQLWLNSRQSRSISVPDLNKLKKEWTTYQEAHSNSHDTNILQASYNQIMFGFCII